MSTYADASTEAGRSTPGSPPRDNLFRAVQPGLELRAAGDDGGMPTLTGHFAVFNQWTEINSWLEGRFMERLAPGAFRKTFRENRDGIKVLFQHGRDPQIGDKPLGPIAALREEDVGAYYEVPLLDTAYVRDLIPGLEAGLYGASFRFSVMREEIVQNPKKSAHNPEGIPERTIREARVSEFGPVTFPAYPEATAGVRSLTDRFVGLDAALLARLDEETQRRLRDALSGGDAGLMGHLAVESREQTEGDAERPFAHLAAFQRRRQIEAVRRTIETRSRA